MIIFVTFMRKCLSFILVSIVSVLVLTSCGGFGKVQRSTDNEYKYKMAKEYFANEKWLNCAVIGQSLLQPFRGTERGEEVLYMVCKSHINNEDYPVARTYIKSYIKSYPRGKYIEEESFDLAYCYYKESPDVKLDQEPTDAAIEALEDYISKFPSSENTGLAKEMLIEMKEKLAEQQLNNVKLYYNLGDYRGNNYMSAIITARNAKKKFPDSRYNEDYSFYILKSYFSQADESVESKQYDRFIDAKDECYSFLKEYPSTKYAKEVESIQHKIDRYFEHHKDKN